MKYNTIQGAIIDADEGDIIKLPSKEYTIIESIIITKGITIQGSSKFGTKIMTSGSEEVFVLDAAATLDGIFINKTDKSSQHLVSITANNAKIINSKFIGQYNQCDAQVERAIATNAGITGYEITDNRFENLRQPGYLEGAGIVKNNFVKNTRGWVICVNYNIELLNNSFEGNAVDIAIIANNQTESKYYADVVDISSSNNGAYVENQLIKKSAKDGIEVGYQGPQ